MNTETTTSSTESIDSDRDGVGCSDLFSLDSVICGECLEIMEKWPDDCVDVVITDPPYGVTQNEWDKALDWAEWWKQVNRICKGAVIATAQQPFTTDLIISNRKRFKWADVWHKTQAVGFLNASVMPLRQHEDILVFGEGRVKYNPQLTVKPLADRRPWTGRTSGTCYGGVKDNSIKLAADDTSHPRSVVKFANDQSGLHPTGKPESLMAYLVATFTNPGDIVLDPFAGSGTTLKAAKELNRRYVGIEVNPEYVKICEERTMQEALPLYNE